MTQQVAPLIPNLGNQAEAMSGAQAMTFTATDRQLIKEIAGEVDKTKNFKEIFFRRDIAHKVENEQSEVNPGQDLKVLESRQRAHERMLENSPLRSQPDRVELLKAETKEGSGLSEADRHSADQSSETDNRQKPLRQETVSLIKELNIDPTELINKFRLNEEELHNLIYRIKELHLKRLLCSTRQEFEEYSKLIKINTLEAAQPAAREWLTAEIDKLTKAAAEYKLKLAKVLKQFQ